MPRGRKPKALEPITFKHSDGASISQLDYKSEKWTVSKLVDFIRKNNINTSVEIQRGLCWNPKQRSLFIHSIIMDYYIPPLLAAKNGNKEYDLLDGKQRALTLREFIRGSFKLKDIPPVPYDDGTEEDFNGLKYSELPEDVQTAISGYNLSMVIFNEGTNREVTEDVFYRANNGTALKASDKNFSKALSKDKITPLISHRIFRRAMTDTAIEKLAPRQVVINSYILLLTDDLSLDSGDVSKFLREHEISDNDKGLLDMLFERLYGISANIEEESEPGTIERKAAKRILGRINIPVLVKFLNTHEDDEKNQRFLEHFFSGSGKATISDAYNDASQSGSGHLENIQKRLNALNEAYEQFE